MDIQTVCSLKCKAKVYNVQSFTSFFIIWFTEVTDQNFKTLILLSDECTVWIFLLENVYIPI